MVSVKGLEPSYSNYDLLLRRQARYTDIKSILCPLGPGMEYEIHHLVVKGILVTQLLQGQSGLLVAR